jgi:alcohol dehydrogenase class IV
MSANVDDVANAMYEMVKEYHGKKNLKALDLSKAMIQKFGEDECDKKLAKLAIRQLIDSGRCTYSYVGGSYIVLPPDS